MQTQEQIKAKIREMLADKDTSELVDKYIDQAMKMRCIASEIEKQEDNYYLPKLILSIIYKRLAFQYMPLTQEGRELTDELDQQLGLRV